MFASYCDCTPKILWPTQLKVCVDLCYVIGCKLANLTLLTCRPMQCVGPAFICRALWPLKKKSWTNLAKHKQYST